MGIDLPVTKAKSDIILNDQVFVYSSQNMVWYNLAQTLFLRI